MPSRPGTVDCGTIDCPWLANAAALAPPISRRECRVPVVRGAAPRVVSWEVEQGGHTSFVRLLGRSCVQRSSILLLFVPARSVAAGLLSLRLGATGKVSGVLSVGCHLGLGRCSHRRPLVRDAVHRSRPDPCSQHPDVVAIMPGTAKVEGHTWISATSSLIAVGLRSRSNPLACQRLSTWLPTSLHYLVLGFALIIVT